jgi:4-hydroxy-4-methyl-2-oxoglutarate aldolase
VIVTGCPRGGLRDIDALAALGVATVHEAIGRSGYLGPQIRPAYPGARLAGTAVTVLCPPGDNLMVHAAVEQCRTGDVLVITTTSPSTDAYVGELVATSLQYRGARGVVTTAGVRDVAALREMSFPAFSGAVSAQGAVKATAGAVNVPVVAGGQRICPGDAVIADDDGVVVVPRLAIPGALSSARERSDRENAARAAYCLGELSLDRNQLRKELERLGVEYAEYQPP